MERQIERQVRGLLDRIPGYRGYRQKEDRRDADRAVRDHLADTLSQQIDRVQRVASELATERRLNEIGPVDAFANEMRHLVDRIRTATYGYGGLWGSRDVDNAALDQLRRFDESLLDGVSGLDEPIARLERALAESGDLAAAARTGSDRVRSLLAQFDLRHEVVDRGEPAPEDAVLAVLEPERPDKPPAAFEIHDRDAIAILGDNYLVDGRIDVESDSDSFRLFHLGDDRGQDRWLLIPRRPGEAFAQFTPASESNVTTSGDQTTIDGVAYTTKLVGSGDGEVIGVGGTSGRRGVRYRLLQSTTDARARALLLDWDGERQILVGEEVHPNDVELFGRSS